MNDVMHHITATHCNTLQHAATHSIHESRLLEQNVMDASRFLEQGVVMNESRRDMINDSRHLQQGVYVSHK